MSLGIPLLNKMVGDYQIPTIINKKIAVCTLLVAGIFTGAAGFTLLSTSLLSIKLASTAVIAMSALIVVIAKRAFPNQQTDTTEKRFTAKSQYAPQEIPRTAEEDAKNKEDYEAAMREDIEVEKFNKLKPIADRGYANAQYAVGQLYFVGLNIESDDKQALHYFKLAANQGHPIASFRAAQMLYDGTYVEQNYKKHSNTANLR